MSSTTGLGEGGMVWKCENDILKDLALLNDFEDGESYTILSTNGRGTNIKEKRKSREKFVDPRSGEVIDINSLDLSFVDNACKGKGRGRRLGGLCVKKNQLQEQLRLARPMGSGDEAMESFCRRNRTGETSTSTSDSDGDSQSAKNLSETTTSVKSATRIIGSRNSALQTNVLINSLIYKTTENASSSTEDDSKYKNGINNSIRNSDSSKKIPCIDTKNDGNDSFISMYNVEGNGDDENNGEEENDDPTSHSSHRSIIDEEANDYTLEKRFEELTSVDDSIKGTDDNIKYSAPKWVTLDKSKTNYCISDEIEFPSLCPLSRKKY